MGKIPVHNWHKYGNTKKIIEIIVRDSFGGKIEKFKCDDKKFPKVINILEKKYGINTK